MHDVTYWFTLWLQNPSFVGTWNQFSRPQTLGPLSPPSPLPPLPKFQWTLTPLTLNMWFSSLFLSCVFVFEMRTHSWCCHILTQVWRMWIEVWITSKLFRISPTYAKPAIYILPPCFLASGICWTIRPTALGWLAHPHRTTHRCSPHALLRLSFTSCVHSRSSAATCKSCWGWWPGHSRRRRGRRWRRRRGQAW